MYQNRSFCFYLFKFIYLSAYQKGGDKKLSGNFCVQLIIILILCKYYRKQGSSLQYKESAENDQKDDYQTFP